MRFINLCGLTIVTLVLNGCANWSSINRTTRIPSPVDLEIDMSKDGQARKLIMGMGSGKAIHLDAQQRVVMINGLQEYCAEPSPDALATFASSLGASANVDDKVNAAVSALFGGNVASFGLRTQSITLMRDAMYRVCEAYMNDALSPRQASLAMTRNQNMAMVFLAIEQLTGAVVSQPVSIVTQGSANSSASLLANQDLLDTARQREADTKAEYEQKQAAKNGIDKDADPDGYENAVTNEKLAKQSYDDAVQNRKTIEKAKNQAFANVNNNISGKENLGSLTYSGNISDETAAHISGAVTEIVKYALSKDYAQDTCLMLLMSETAPRDSSAYNVCEKYLSNSVEDVLISNPEDMKSKALLSRYVDDPKFRITLKSWVDKNIAKGINMNFFLYIEQYQDFRAKAYDELIEREG